MTNSKSQILYVAFTLAEVLITIAIVGVVAAITIPTLIQNAKEKSTVTRVKETYSILSQAYKHAEEEYGTPENWYTGNGNMSNKQSHIDMATPMKKFMKLSEDCVGKGDDYTYKNCSKYYYTENKYASFVLANGVSVIFRTWEGRCNWRYASTRKATTCGEIITELEPNKSKQNSENTFSFYLTTEGIVPYGVPSSYLTFENACNKSIETPYPKFSSENMYACTAWVIYNGNMDYLRCDDLSWDGKHTCK